MAEFTIMLNSDYGIKKKPITTRNPQANAIIERIHQTIGNILRTFCIQDSQLDNEDPWSGILAATMFATRATVHTTLKATPMQLVFSRDAIFRKTKSKRLHIQNRQESNYQTNSIRQIR